ncbi:MAG: hypothetical protein R3B45_08770 [Bdellovibrionota bacterium]
MLKTITSKSYFTCLLLIVFYLFLSTSCSFRRLAIANGDYLVKRKIYTYVSLKDDQKQKLDGYVDKIWKQVPTYWLAPIVDELKRLEKTLQDGLTQEDIQTSLVNFRKIMKEFWLTHGEGASELLLSLSSKQLDELASNLEDGNEWIKDKLEKSEKELKEEWLENELEGFEKFYGAPTKKQSDLITETLVSVSRVDLEKHLASRRSSQESFVAFLKEKPTRKELNERVLRWIERPELLRIGKFQQEYLKRRALWIEKLSWRDALANSEQRAYLRHQLTTLIGDLRSAF